MKLSDWYAEQSRNEATWCADCDGEGITDEVACSACGGSGLAADRRDPTLSDVAEFTRELRRIGAAIMAGDLHPPGYDEFIARKRDLLEGGR